MCLWAAHLRRCAGAELQRRLTVEEGVYYDIGLADVVHRRRTVNDDEEQPWPPTLPLDALALSTAHVAYKATGCNGGDPEEEGYGFAKAALCFGVALPYSDLRSMVYIGRRFYKSGGASESVEDEPDRARGPYFDFTDEAALKHALTSTGYGGPWLKYHLHTAIKDLLIRIGMPNHEPAPSAGYQEWAREHNMGVHSDVSIACTGFQDSAGDDVVLGIRLGPYMDAAGFDLKSQLGMSFLQESAWNELYGRFRGDDVDDASFEMRTVSTDFLAELLGWPVDSPQHRAVERELRARMKKVLCALKWPQGPDWLTDGALDALLEFHVVFNADC